MNEEKDSQKALTQWFSKGLNEVHTNINLINNGVLDQP
jgi:hypothetical protein